MRSQSGSRLAPNRHRGDLREEGRPVRSPPFKNLDRHMMVLGDERADDPGLGAKSAFKGYWMPLRASGCNRVAHDEVDGAPNLVTLRECLGELDSRGGYEALSGLGARGNPWKARNYWLEMERVEGIEPSPIAWEAIVVPFNYTRFSCLHGALKRRVQ